MFLGDGCDGSIREDSSRFWGGRETRHIQENTLLLPREKAGI
jgi:hypothetical protein